MGGRQEGWCVRWGSCHSGYGAGYKVAAWVDSWCECVSVRVRAHVRWVSDKGGGVQL